MLLSLTILAIILTSYLFNLLYSASKFTSSLLSANCSKCCWNPSSIPWVQVYFSFPTYKSKIKLFPLFLGFSLIGGKFLNHMFCLPLCRSYPFQFFFCYFDSTNASKFFFEYFLSCRSYVSFILKLFMAAIFLFTFPCCCSASLISRVKTFNFGFVLCLLLVLVVCWAELINISVKPRIADSTLHV